MSLTQRREVTDLRFVSLLLLRTRQPPASYTFLLPGYTGADGADLSCPGSSLVADEDGEKHSSRNLPLIHVVSQCSFRPVSQ
jgi:hypothetical protein